MVQVETFTVGERVAIIRDRRVRGIVTVVKVTPSGQIVTDNGQRFAPDGYERGQTPLYRSHIRKLTPQYEAEYTRAQTLERISYVRWDALTDDQLRAIVAIIDAPQEPQP